MAKGTWAVSFRHQGNPSVGCCLFRSPDFLAEFIAEATLGAALLQGGGGGGVQQAGAHVSRKGFPQETTQAAVEKEL